jgi:non-specific serine/threonine protein kinase
VSQDAAEYRFGRFVVQPHKRRLLADGRPVTAGPRAFDVLLALVKRAGQLVTKDELLERVWPELIVEENNLQVQVSALRKILGQDVIATIPGRGYRFTALVQLVAQQTSDAAVRAHNLPQPLTSFVGHENDLAEYAHTLEQTRLLTLSGIGGCGKTRLAIELARMVVPSFPDGVWFVDLAPVAEPERVATAVATTLAVREEVGKPIDETVAHHLADRQLLLVLDNCEHVVAACATLAERFLMAAPGVRALITSREGLGIAGERVVPVRSLASPPVGSIQAPGAIAEFEAVRLFVDRARHMAPNFALNDANAAAIAEICHRLDGIPLALELAAARIRMLSVEQICAKLDDRFRLLTGNLRAMSRHQTLLATMQWSYDHLTPVQQQLLRRLSVFAGGWTLDGAVRIAGEALDEYEVLDRLARLADQSLITIQRVEDGTTRYSMLETVRQYAQERLNEAQETESTRNRHVDFYVALAEQAEPELVGREQSTWLARLDVERENFVAAHAWCNSMDEFAPLALRLVHSLNQYWVKRAQMALGHRLTVRALMQPGVDTGNLSHCRALWAAAVFAYFMGRYAEARDWVEQSLTIAREIREERNVVEALRLLGYVVLALGDRELARQRFEEALGLARQAGDKRQLASALNALAVWHSAEGDLDKSEPLFEGALGIERELADPGSIAIGLTNLAFVSTHRGLGERARVMLREGLAIADEIGLGRAGIVLLGDAADLAASFNEWEFAARLYGASDALADRVGYQHEPLQTSKKVQMDTKGAADYYSAFRARFIAQTRDALGSDSFAEAESAGRALSYDAAIAEARAWLEQRS